MVSKVDVINAYRSIKSLKSVSGKQFPAYFNRVVADLVVGVFEGEELERVISILRERDPSVYGLVVERLSVRRVLKLMVAEVLVGRVGLVRAAYDYVVNGMSISRAASKHGFTRYQLRGFVSRLKSNMPWSVFEPFLRHVYQVYWGSLRRLRPVIEGNRCLICGKRVVLGNKMSHVYHGHRKIIESIVESLMYSQPNPPVLKHEQIDEEVTV